MSNQTTTGWMPQPDTRGTWGILISCTTTLFLCVYTALHLNIPKKGAGKFRTSLHKLRWVLMGMFAPELVVFTAWSQWMSARELTRRVNRSLKNQTDGENGSKETKWTMMHSFYAQMGGFVIDTDDPEEPQYIPDSPRLVLSAHGAAVLAEMGRLPEISKEFIVDKSKTDSLGKTIVVIQAVWLILQCLGRAIDHLPLTCLELNTLAHAACALIMYFLWWNKPVDIRDPIVLSGTWRRPLVAAMWMFSHISTQKDPYSKGALFPPEIESLVYAERACQNSPSTPIPGRTLTMVEAHTALQFRQSGLSRGRTNPLRFISLEEAGVKNLEDTLIKRNTILLPFCFGPKNTSHRFRTRDVSRTRMPRYYTPRVETTVNTITVNRWKLAQQCFAEHPEIWNRYRKEIGRFVDKGELWILHEYPNKLCKDSFLDPGCPNWPGSGLIRVGGTFLSVLFFSLCVAVYGALHTVAWNDYFPTSTERLLWRLSAVYIAGSGLLYVFMEIVNPIMRSVGECFGHAEKPYRECQSEGIVGCCMDTIEIIVTTLISVLLAWVATGGICMYVFARAFVIVEAFISLRDLPRAVYETPKWTPYLSHL